MNDLIGKSELLKRFSATKDGHRILEKNCDIFEVTMSIKDVKTIIKEQPIAYDVDEVIEELEKLKDEDSITKIEKLIVKTYIDRAIEIVKDGGISNDICKWKIFNNSLNYKPHWVYETTCGKYIEEKHTSKSFVYCPHCGKKIKVVK